MTLCLGAFGWGGTEWRLCHSEPENLLLFICTVHGLLSVATGWEGSLLAVASSNSESQPDLQPGGDFHAAQCCLLLFPVSP